MPLNMRITLSQVYRDAANNYLAAIPANVPRPEPEDIELDVLNILANKVSYLNDEIIKGSKQRIPLTLPPYVIARIVNALWPVCKIPCAGAETDPAYDVLGLYQDSGPNKGIYMTSELVFKDLFSRFNTAGTIRDFNEFMVQIERMAERKLPCRDKDLIAVNNGIFDYKHKKLLPFSPDHIFLSKCRVNYVPAAVNPVIHNPDDNTDWDVESWMGELSNDPEIVNLLWEILGAVIRPNVSWNKAAFLYSETGNNGKGTLCALMRNLCGPGTSCSIPLTDFGREFMLEPLVRASAIIVDENNVGDFADKSGNMKAVITGDVIGINRKYEKPLSFQFRGFMVQCVNELPRVKDKSDSLYRRFLFVPFRKCFTGCERRYIKDDYLHRPEVLEYVLFKVLNMDCYELSTPAACQALMAEYKETNDPLRQFANEIFSLLTWDMVPLAYLFDLYVAWFKRCNPGGHLLGKQKFNAALCQMQAEIPGWTCPGLDAVKRPGTDMSKPEPLTREYNLVSWANPACPNVMSPHWAVPCPKQKYKGYFLRTSSPTPAVAATPSPFVAKTV